MWKCIGTIVFSPAGTAYEVYMYTSLTGGDALLEAEPELSHVREVIAMNGVAALARRFRLVPASGRAPDTSGW